MKRKNFNKIFSKKTWYFFITQKIYRNILMNSKIFGEEMESMSLSIPLMVPGWTIGNKPSVPEACPKQLWVWTLVPPMNLTQLLKSSTCRFPCLALKPIQDGLRTGLSLGQASQLRKPMKRLSSFSIGINPSISMWSTEEQTLSFGQERMMEAKVKSTNLQLG